jgi:hypothetical protein
MSSDPDKSFALASKWQWAVLIAGLAIWLGLQGYLILMPVFSRYSPPEPKDTIPYIARTERMGKCFTGNCPALKDLAAQFSPSSSNPEVNAYRSWASTIFGSNELAFSLILLALRHLGLDVMTGYRVISVVAVLIFGVGFAYLLSVLWDKPTAGLALFLLAFKTFPDTGLNFVVPSNLCMGLATLICARIISKNGRALWTLGIGSLVLVAFHPMGAAYSLIAAILALTLSGVTFSRRTWLTAAVVGLVLTLALVLPRGIYNLSEYLSYVGPRQILTQGVRSLAKVVVEIVRLDKGLYGSLPIFLACAVLGVILTAPDHRRRVNNFLKIFSIFLAVSLFYPPREPGDTFFRLWIPFVAAIFGLVAVTWKATLALAWESLKRFPAYSQETARAWLQEAWPIVAAAVITGYAVQMSLAGAEQIIAMSEHLKNLWPLRVCSRQTEALLADAHPGDRVLYESMMLMNCYFAGGALKLGAVYYAPVLRGTVTDGWLKRPDLRFAVAFNPLAIHPSFAGLHERRWGVSCPAFRYSPLMAQKRYAPLLHEDGIEVSRFKYLDVEWPQDHDPESMSVMIENPGTACTMRVSSVNDSGVPLEHPTVVLKIPERSGVSASNEFKGTPDLGLTTDRHHSTATTFKIDLARMRPASRLRLSFPAWNSRARIVGIRFDNSRLNWPWGQKARLIVADDSWRVGITTYSFDPARILPKPLRHNKVKVLNDCGSSVLLEIARPVKVLQR